MCNAPLLDEGDRDLLWLPMSHIFGFGELCVGNALGWETYLASPADVLDLLPEVAPQVFFSVPAYWEKIARAIQAGPSTAEARSEALRRVTGGRLRFCLSGGAGLKVEIKQLLHAAGVLVIEGYGLTETSPTLTLNRPDAFRFDTVGKPLPSVELKLDDDGEILARGDERVRRLLQGSGRDRGGVHRRRLVPHRRHRPVDRGRLPPDHRSQEGHPRHRRRQEHPAREHRGAVRRRSGDRARRRLRRRAARTSSPRCGCARTTCPPTSARGWSPRGSTTINARARALRDASSATSSPTLPLTVEDGLLTSSLKLRRKAVYERLRDRFEALYA